MNYYHAEVRYTNDFDFTVKHWIVKAKNKTNVIKRLDKYYRKWHCGYWNKDEDITLTRLKDKNEAMEVMFNLNLWKDSKMEV